MKKEIFDRILDLAGQDVLKEHEIYVDDDGVAHDDEGNSWQTGKSGGVYGLKDFRGRRTHVYSKPKSSEEDKACKFGDKMGVDKEDVKRYIEEAKKKKPENPWPAVYARIKRKAKQ